VKAHMKYVFIKKLKLYLVIEHIRRELGFYYWSSPCNCL